MLVIIGLWRGRTKVGGELHVAMLRFLASQVFLGRLPLSFLLFFCFLVFVVVVCQFKQMDLNQRGVMHLSQIVRSTQFSLAVTTWRNELDKGLLSAWLVPTCSLLPKKL